MALESTIKEMAHAARQAAKQLGRVCTGQKNAALSAIADYLEKEAAFIKEQNRRDLAHAENQAAAAGRSPGPRGRGVEDLSRRGAGGVDAHRRTPMALRPGLALS